LWLRRSDKLADSIKYLLASAQGGLQFLLPLSLLHPQFEKLPLLLKRREPLAVRGFLLAVAHFLLALLGLFGEPLLLLLSLPPCRAGV
jgi:hypothetical protein